MKKLIAAINRDTINTSSITGVKQIQKRVIQAMASVDRAHYVRPEDRACAYEDCPLDIGYGQTISQPFIVALITHLIDPQPTETVLEIGTGSGYQAAILANLCAHVFGLEIISDLAQSARKNLARDGIKNVTVLCDDGNRGLPEHAPFDKIIVSAAAQKIPQTLVDQLKVGGVMLVPVHTSYSDQVLVRVTKTSSSVYNVQEILPVRFVPLVQSPQKKS